MAADNRLPAVIGHRGAAGHAPENTLAGLRKAHDLGVTCVEFDDMLSADGVPVLFHDETLERTSDGTGRLSSQRWEDLQKLDAGSWFGPVFAGEPIPSLHQAMAVLGALGMKANVELKPSRGQDAMTGVITAKTLQESWPAVLPAPVISSFSGKSLVAAADQAPEFPRALLVWEFPDDWRARADAVGATAVHASRKHLTRDQARAILDAGYALRIYTVNDGTEGARFYDWGAESLFTDYPERIVPR